MRDVIITVLWVGIVATVVTIVTTVGGLAYMVRSQRRRNRFGRRDRVVAPVTWLYTPGEAPRLHRRLLGAVASARRAAVALDSRRVSPSGIREMAIELEEQAGAIDDGLILASRLHSVQRRELLERLGPAVTEIEIVAKRLVHMATSVSVSAQSTTLDLSRLHDRLDALEAAQREISELERFIR